MTLSTALKDSLADVQMVPDQLATCIFRKGFPAGMGAITLQVVQAEIAYILAHDDCALLDPALTEFWDRAFHCLRNADITHLYNLQWEVTALTAKRGLGKLWFMYKKPNGSP